MDYEVTYSDIFFAKTALLLPSSPPSSQILLACSAVEETLVLLPMPLIASFQRRQAREARPALLSRSPKATTVWKRTSDADDLFRWLSKVWTESRAAMRTLLERSSHASRKSGSEP